MRKLTIVVTCTDRKSLPVESHLRVRSLPDGSIAERGTAWRRRHRRYAPTRELVDLYQGESWSQARQLVQDAASLGFTPRVLVASAGLGLRTVDGPPAPAYGATFAARQADSVAADRNGTRSWWKRLQALPNALDPDVELRGRLMLVLSEPYAIAMHDDLVALARRSSNALMFGGDREVDGLPRFASDAALRHALGGTRSSLNLRMARKWLAQLDSADLNDVRARHRWDRWAREVRTPELYDRVRQSDDAILEHIANLTTSDPSISRTRALRILRDSGFACEQRRFAMLFQQAMHS